MRIVVTLALSCLLLAGCSKEEAKPPVIPTPTIQGVEVFSGLSHAHLGKGDYPQSYPQSPPVGGPHSVRWLKCGSYTQPLPKENAVHSIEHGAIWLTYATDATAADTVALGELAKLSPEYVLVSPYAGQDNPVIATTWGLQLRVDSPADPRLVAFVKQYAGGNQGGEPGVGCARGGLTPEEALQFNASQR